MKRWATAVLLAVLLCGVQAARADWPTEDQNRMLPLFYALWSKYSDDLQSGDTAKIASWFTEKAVVMESGKDDVAGREKIQKYLEGILAQGRISDADIRPGETEVCGDRVYQFGTFSRTIQGGTAESSTNSGRFFSVWERQGDGSWKIARLMYSIDR